MGVLRAIIVLLFPLLGFGGTIDLPVENREIETTLEVVNGQSQYGNILAVQTINEGTVVLAGKTFTKLKVTSISTTRKYLKHIKYVYVRNGVHYFMQSRSGVIAIYKE